MTDPDPAGALASSPLQQEEEDRATRVAPLTAGVGGQDLPQRSQPAEVTAAERTEMKAAIRFHLHGLADLFGAQIQHCSSISHALKVIRAAVYQVHGVGSHHPAERPQETNAVDPHDRRVDGSQRAADSSQRIADLEAEIARLRHLAHQLEGEKEAAQKSWSEEWDAEHERLNQLKGYLRHRSDCELTRFGTDVQIPLHGHVCGLSGYNGMIDPECPGCADSRNHNYRGPRCTCGLAALTEPPA